MSVILIGRKVSKEKFNEVFSYFLPLIEPLSVKMNAMPQNLTITDNISSEITDLRLPHFLRYNVIKSGINVIICIHKRNKTAPCKLKAFISGTAGSFILLMNHADSAVLLCPFVAKSCGTVYRTVINQKNFKILHRLIYNRFQTAV